MSRLNKATREYIVGQALAKAEIDVQRIALEKERFDWVNRVRVAANGMSDADLQALEDQHEALKDKVPKDLRVDYRLVAKREYCYPNLGGMRVGHFAFAPERESDRSRFAMHEPTLAADHPLADEFYALEKRREELENRAKVIKAQVWAVVDSVTTIKKLLEVWPEARELLPPDEQPVITNVPAVLITSLNSAIGLPTEDATCA